MMNDMKKIKQGGVFAGYQHLQEAQVSPRVQELNTLEA